MIKDSLFEEYLNMVWGPLLSQPRDPDRIPEVLEAIKQLWEQHPDWRLGQLIRNVAPLGKDVFYVEDDVLLEGLQDLIERGSDGSGQAKAGP